MFIFKKKKEEAKIIKLGDSGFVISIPQGVISKPEEPPLTNKSWIQRLEEDLKEDLKDLEDESEYHDEIYKEFMESFTERFESELDEALKPLKAWIGKDNLAMEVSDAWNVPGRAPGYHRKMQKKLRKEWPVLAAALDRL